MAQILSLRRLAVCAVNVLAQDGLCSDAYAICASASATLADTKFTVDPEKSDRFQGLIYTSD